MLRTTFLRCERIRIQIQHSCSLHYHHDASKPQVSSAQPNEQGALPCGRNLLQIILSVVQTQMTQGLPAHLKEENTPVDFLRAKRGDQNHSAESRDEDKQSKCTHGSQGQGTSSSQEIEVPERKRTGK